MREYLMQCCREAQARKARRKAIIEKTLAVTAMVLMVGLWLVAWMIR